MQNPNVPMLTSLLRQFDLAGYRLLRQSYFPETFGDGEVLFVQHPIRLRFIFDRGQRFLELAFEPQVECFYQFDDVRLAFGWTTLDAIFARKTLEPLESQLADLKSHLADLQRAAEPAHVEALWQRLENAGELREQAVLHHLRSLRPSSEEGR